MLAVIKQVVRSSQPRLVREKVRPSVGQRDGRRSLEVASGLWGDVIAAVSFAALAFSVLFQTLRLIFP